MESATMELSRKEEGHDSRLSEDGKKIWVLDSSVDHKGRIPVRAKTGVWKAALFIIGIEFGERLSFFGLSTNLIIYLTKVLQKEVKIAAKSVNYWIGVTTISPLLGGFLADSYLGRFHTVLISTILYLLGLAMLTASQYAPQLKTGNGALKTHELIFFTAMYLIAIATGGHKAALESFGGDQFDGDHPEERKKKMSYFNWWNTGLCSGLVLGVTLVVYLQDNIGWGVADVALMAIMAVGLLVFYSGRPLYRFRTPAGSPLTPLVQVLVAAIAKRKLPHPSNPSDLYENHTRNGSTEEYSRKRMLSHTGSLRFLDKAAIVECDDDEGSSLAAERPNPWRLATVTQVEETKLIVHMIPIWITTQTFGLCLAQGSTFFIKQASIMDRRLTSTFEIPPASIYALSALGMILAVTIYDKLLVPFLRRTTGNERGIGILQRMGIGMAFSSLSMAIAAIVERRRREGAREETMSVFWLSPQFIVLGIGDGFTLVGLQEYFYEQVPEGMRSIGIAFYLSVLGVSNFASGMLITVVDHVTGAVGRSWFGKDLDASNLDCYYWLLAVINTVNIFVYSIVARSHSRKGMRRRVGSDHESSRNGIAKATAVDP